MTRARSRPRSRGRRRTIIKSSSSAGGTRCCARICWRRIKIPVSVRVHTFDQPRRDYDSYDVNFKTTELLRQAGVKVAFSNGSTKAFKQRWRKICRIPSPRNRWHSGLPEEDALKGITLYPAELLGVNGRLGSIEPGKEATLFVCDGNLSLDIRANVTRMWIAGHEVSLQSRHTRLFEKYKNRPAAK